MNKLYNILISFLLICAIIILVFKNEMLLTIMPLSYLVAKVILLFISNVNLKFTRMVYDVFGIIRLLVIPLLIGITGDKIIDNLPLGHEYFNQAVGLISVEYIIGAVFLYIFSKLFTNKVSVKSINYKVAGSKIFYAIFIVVVFLYLYIVKKQEKVYLFNYTNS
ncbi:hypothetical protein AAHH63_03120 [Staphylococcus haemolyticus]